jgi:hypothetical protein
MFVCGWAIKFSDGGDPELQIMHRGTKEDCEHMLSLVPAVAYSGERPGAQAFTFLIPADEWDGATTERM